jgi:toxin YoeB
MRIVFSKKALEQYDSWAAEGNAKAREKIHALLENILETPYVGIGKPEPLKYELAGTWSRRINRKDRLRYRVRDDAVEVISCRDHYDA